MSEASKDSLARGQEPGYKNSSMAESNTIVQLSKPKIVLEALSARSIMQIMAIIVISFIGCFALDTQLTYSTFSNAHARTQYLMNCTDSTLSSIKSGRVQTDMGCIENGYGTNKSETSWFGVYGNLFNVLGVDASFHSTELSVEAPTEKAVEYDYMLLGCALAGGCGDVMTNRGEGRDQWHLVVDVRTDTAAWYPVKPVIYRSHSKSTGNDDDEVKSSPKNWQLNFFHLLQNQEALPTNGYVKSYYMKIDIHDITHTVFHDPKNYMVVDVSEGTEGVLVYFFEFFTIVLMLVTAIVLYYYVQMVQKFSPRIQEEQEQDIDIGSTWWLPKHWLPEQKWVCGYLVILFLYQNPFFIGADLGKPDPHSALTAFIVSYLSQTSFMVLWLCMADSVNYTESSWWLLAKFYAPKILFGIIIFIPACVMLGFQFPSIEHMDEASSMLAVQMWPLHERKTFIAFSFIFLILYWVWALAWFIRLYLTHRHLRLIPYISSRYQQLLFRFYLLQMSFVAIYTLLQYAFAAYYIGYADKSPNRDNVELADDVNIMFKQQTEMFGKIIFLSLVGFLLAFVTLPAGFILTGDDFTNMASVFAITEVEKNELLELRKEYIEQRVRLNRLRLGMNAFQGTKKMMRGDYVFCLEQALDLLRVSNEVYDETEGEVAEVKASMSKSLASYGFNVIELIPVPEKQLMCVICRQVSTNRVVVAFRGTVSMENMKMNLDRALVPYELSSYTMPALDRLDGLDDNMDSIPGDDDDDDEGTTNRGSIFSVRLSGLWKKKKKKKDNDRDKDEGKEDRGSAKRRPSRLTKSQRLNRKNSTEVLGDDPIAADADVEAGEGGGSTKSIASRASDDVMRNSMRISRELDEEKFMEQLENQENDDRADQKALKLATTAIKQTGDIFLLTLHNTPGLSGLARPRVHTGFLGSYNSMREQIHRVVRNELRENPGEVCATGHSLGGALATLCVIDLTVHTLPRVRAYYRRKEAVERTNRGVASMINAVMYTFGQPRVGDPVFSSVFDNLCPESFRVVVDGDVIVSVPKNVAGYRHAGTSVIVDSKEVGNIIVDPSFVERFFRTKKVYLGVSVHSLKNYEECLKAVQRAAGATGVVVSAEDLDQAKKKEGRNSGGAETMQRIIRETVVRQSQHTRTLSSDTFVTARDTLSPLGHRLTEMRRSSILEEL